MEDDVAARSSAPSFFVGKQFSSFEELEQQLKLYEAHNFVQFWRRDSRTIQAAQRRVNKAISEKLKYYEITYRCIHGGKKFKARGTGKRTTSTFRKDCGAELKLRASDDGLRLIVRNFCDEHNHPISRELFKQLPQQRKLSLTERQTAENLLSLNANKKMIQDKLVKSTGKIILLKDLSNVNTKLNSSKSRNDLEESVKHLKDIHGASVEILVSESNMLLGIFFQDEEMKKMFSSYPELVCIDATYKLLELRFPVYIMLVEDGNGQSEVVAVFLLMEETEQSIKSMVGIFKKYNPQWKATRVLMTDKDMTERDVLAAEFPSAELIICLFHTFRSFRREVVVDKMGITSGQRNMCLELLQEMAYATSEESYQVIYTRFCECAPPTVISYFNTQWHPIRRQWIMGMKYKTGNFLNGTNNRLECINQKLKSVISRYSSLEEFVEKFFLILRVLRSERDHKAALLAQKVPVAYHSLSDEASLSYMKYLTPYAYQFLAKQMELKKKVSLEDKGDGMFVSASSEGLITVSSSTCQCTSWKSMKLPCRHILMARSRLGISLYDESLCDKRWSTAYYRENQRIFSSEEMSSNNHIEIVQPPPRRNAMSQAEKFKYASRLTTKLASLASETTKDEFTARCKLLEKIVLCWEAGQAICPDSIVASESYQEQPLSDAMTEHHSLPSVEDWSLSNMEVEDQSSSIIEQSDVVSANHPSSVVEDQPFSITELVQPSSITEDQPSSMIEDQPCTRVLENQPLSTSDWQSDGVVEGQPPSSMVVGCQSFSDAECPPVCETIELQTGESETERQSSSSKQIKHIIMPPAIKKRGRSKGREVTVIGLPAKKGRKNTSESCMPRLQPFIKLHTSSKEKVMLRWFVEDNIVETTIKSLGKYLIEEEDVETRPERVPCAVLDENVDVHLIRKFFSNDAWLVVVNVVEQKQRNPNFICKCCYHDLHESSSVVCEHCLSWYHIKCVGLKQEPKARYWYCRDCHECPLV